MAGSMLATDYQAVFIGAIAAGFAAPDEVPATGTEGALPGTAPGDGKVTAVVEYPAKRRATAGVRANSVLKGEDTLLLAWAGHGPAKASSSAGVARSLPQEHGRRHGSGIPLSQAVDVIGPSMAWPESA
jgi:DNA gyrase subunit A